MSGRRIDRKKPPGQALTVCKLARPLSYAQGSLQIYFCLLPDFLLEDLLQGVGTGKKRWSTKRRKKKWYAVTGNAIKVAKADLQGGRFDYMVIEGPARGIFDLQNRAEEAAELHFADKDLPEELFAVCLWEAQKNRVVDSISISLPKECGTLAVEQVIALTKPYLSRINSAALVGEESEAANVLENYLYDEYGIPVSYEKYPLKNTIWIDLEEHQNTIYEKYVNENGIYHLNKAEVMKFLDTTAKNGYNTKVN